MSRKEDTTSWSTFVGRIFITLLFFGILAIVFFWGFYTRENLSRPMHSETGLMFQNATVRCFRHEAHPEGYVWACDNGYFEYDTSGVRFPSIPTDNQ